MNCLLIAIASLLSSVQQGEDITFGIICRSSGETPGILDGVAFERGARMAVESWNADGKSTVRIRVVVERPADAKALTKSVASLRELGATAVALAPMSDGHAREVLQACRRVGLPALGIGAGALDIVAAVEDLVLDRMRLRRLIYLHDHSPSAKSLGKALTKALKKTSPLAFSGRVSDKPAKIAKKAVKTAADAVLVDADSTVVQAMIPQLLAELKLPVFLTGRSHEPGRTLPDGVFLVAGRAASTASGAEEFNAAFAERHDGRGRGAARGFESLNILARALNAKLGNDVPRYTARLGATRFSGPSGDCEVRHGDDGLEMRHALAIWWSQSGKPLPLLPGIEDSGVRAFDDRGRRISRAKYGVAFGDDRSHRFALEEDTQWVWCHWGSPKERTIEEDLRKLGLSSSGAAPLADHLVREEIMARMIAVTSEKYLRNPDGSAIPGKSLQITFAAKLPPKVRPSRVWQVIVAGDDPAAGGRAFPGSGIAKTFSTHLQRVVYKGLKLEPPLCADDIPTLLGCTSEDEFFDDVRAREIHAYIDGIAGGLALTSAHEVGHLAGLGHILDDPVGIMNVNEGAGIDYREGRFSKDNLERLRKALGVAERKSP